MNGNIRTPANLKLNSRPMNAQGKPHGAAPEEEEDDTPEVSRAPRCKRFRHRSAWLTVSLMTLAGLTAASTYIVYRPVTVEESPAVLQPAQAGELAHCKAAPGLIEAESGECALSFEVGGKLRAIYVDEGQAVKAGDPIAELENAELRAKVRANEAGLSAAQTNLALLKGNLASAGAKAESEVCRLSAELALLEPRTEEVEGARAEATAAEADARRAKEDEQRYANPAGRGMAWSAQLYDQSRRLAEAAAAKLAAAQARFHELEAGSRPEDKSRLRAMLAGAQAEVARHKANDALELQLAQVQLAQAQAQLELAQAELEKTRLKAPISGTVLRKYMHAGEIIDALHATPVVSVADLSHLRVRARVDEADFPSIQAGQRVKVTADAFGTQKFLSGTVEKISSVTGEKGFSTGEARERMDVKVVEVLVKFDQPPPRNLVKLGLRVTAYFQTESE